MKKIISLVIASMMAVSMLATGAVCAMAETTTSVNSPTAAVLQPEKAQLTVNGESRQGVTYTPSTTNPNAVTFTYNGEGTLTGWSDNLDSLSLVAGTDYTKVTNTDGSLTITFITQKAISTYNAGSVVVNAIVDFGTTTTAATTEEEEDTEEEDTTETTTKTNTSSKSPATGSSTALAAGVIAAAGAGFAVLAATKKKNEE